ncbi:MAG: GNAT family N-acetyltransferase [Deltaproteobacteria bacterium]|nr:GNAT family N-acetyltransferase [Deltaproteobacteria bacterium]
MDIRAIAPDQVAPWTHAVSSTFGMDPAADPTFEDRVRALLDLGRTFACFDRGQIVGTAAGFDMELTLPGGRAPMSGLTMVTVRPTHRRRGILRALIDAHLEAARAHGDPVSGLWASEATIYGRFGYGVAAESDALTISDARDTLALGRTLDELTIIDTATAPAAVRPIYDRVARARPGMFARGEAWWRHRRLHDRPDQRDGGTQRTYALARRGDDVTGYMAFRQKLSKAETGFTGAFTIDELVALDARAEATLWSLAVNADLYPRVSYWNAPTDALAPWLVADRRRVTRRRVDTLWLRVGDVAATLAARSYGADGALVLGVEGEAWHLEVAGQARACARHDGPAELTLDRAALGSILLGATSPALLARCDRAHGSAEIIARAERMFASPVPAWCPEVF